MGNLDNFKFNKLRKEVLAPMAVILSFSPILCNGKVCEPINEPDSHSELITFGYNFNPSVVSGVSATAFSSNELLK